MSEEKPTLKIDEEFQFLIPPLPKEDYLQLDRNILRDGCLDPIKVWDGHDTIIDGHNRYKICTEKNREYKIHPIKLDTREEVINWIIDNQVGRRNLTPSQASYLRGKKYNNEKKLAHRPEKGDQSDHLKTSEKIAKEEKIGSATVRRDAKFATAVDFLKDDAGLEFGKKLISEEIKLPKTDVIKLANKPAEERKALVDEIQTKGANSLGEAETALEIKKPQPKEAFTKAGADIEFAGWTWNPRMPEAPKNTHAPRSGSETKQRLVYLTEDIFGKDFTEEETNEIIRTMKESHQWIFMVHTKSLERLDKIQWPANVAIGCVVDSQSAAEKACSYFATVKSDTRFIICDLSKDSIFFDALFGFDWIIISNSSKVQPPWMRLESVLEQAHIDGLWIYLMPNITVRPREYPILRDEVPTNQIQDAAAQESAKEAA
jgi:hypothetical protein